MVYKPTLASNISESKEHAKSPSAQEDSLGKLTPEFTSLKRYEEILSAPQLKEAEEM